MLEVIPSDTVATDAATVTEVLEYLQWLHPQDDRPINIFAKSRKVGERGTTRSTINDAAEVINAVKDADDTLSLWVNVHRPKVDADAPKGRFNKTMMESYQFLAIDIDRPKVIEPKASATDAEHAETLTVARRIMERFRDDLPQPLLVDSGNGHLLLYPIDLPYTDDNKALLAKVGEGIADAFGKEHIDLAPIADVARVFGVVGTINRNKVEIVDQGRVHRPRRIIGDYVDRTPMDAEAFTAWAKSFIGQGAPVALQVAGAVAGEVSDPSKASDADKIKAASAWLSKRDGAIEGQGGDLFTFQTAGQLLAFNLTVDQVHTLMMEQWNSRCVPPWSSDELLVKVRSAATNGTPRAPKVIRSSDDEEWLRSLNPINRDIQSTTTIAKETESDGLTFTDWSKVKRGVAWLWDQHFPIGVSLLAGIGGVGKSYVSLNLAAAITKGGKFPDGTDAPKGDVILFACEDQADVLIDRFEGQGGDIDRLHHFESQKIRTKDGTVEKYFELSDVELVRKAIKRYPNTKLIIIDPIHAFVGDKVDSHKTADVRRVMMPLVKLASEANIAVLGIIHFGKDNQKAAWSRISGSGAWRDLARSVFVACQDKRDEKLGLLVHEKHNYSPRQLTKGFRMDHGTHKLTWEVVDDITADQALNGGDESPKLTEAKEWLTEYLSGGQRWADDINHDRMRARITDDTLRRAADALGVEKKRKGFGGRWYWQLPMPQAPDDRPPF